MINKRSDKINENMDCIYTKYRPPPVCQNLSIRIQIRIQHQEGETYENMYAHMESVGIVRVLRMAVMSFPPALMSGHHSLAFHCWTPSSMLPSSLFSVVIFRWKFVSVAFSSVTIHFSLGRVTLRYNCVEF